MIVVTAVAGGSSHLRFVVPQERLDHASVRVEQETAQRALADDVGHLLTGRSKSRVCKLGGSE